MQHFFGGRIQSSSCRYGVKEKLWQRFLNSANGDRALIEELSRLILSERNLENEFEAVLELANRVCDRHGLKQAA